MRIISLVPSWTETLIESGIYPVGRTRFCIHPKGRVENIPIVGGTKTVNWDLIKQLNPDLLILDQEENPQEFAAQGLPFWDSHVTDGISLEVGLKELALILNNASLKKMAKLCNQINARPSASPEALKSTVLKTLKPWNGNEEVAYIIWNNPWMTVTNETYIGFVLQKLGVKLYVWPAATTKYPSIELDLTKNLLYLFSSEPFPFLKHEAELKTLNTKAAIVDGEKFSWFGIRSLRFLQEALGLPDPE